MNEKNLNEPNPKLEKDDRIILVYMEGEDTPIGSVGVVENKVNQPKFKPSDPGYGYMVSFFEKDTKKYIKRLVLLPECDIWLYDKDYYENENLKESIFSMTKKNINKIKI